MGTAPATGQRLRVKKRAVVAIYLERAGLLLTVALVATPLSAKAEGFGDVFRAGPSDALLLTPADAIIAPAALAVFGGVPLLHLAPARCRLCDGPDDSGLPGSAGSGRGSLNGVDAFFHDALTSAVVSRKTADTTSTVLAYGVTPAFALGTALFATGPHASYGAGVRAAVIVLESVALAGAATQVLKVGVARKRPYVRYGTGTTEAPYDVGDDESRQGFVSGHTSAVAALGISAALCASLQESEAAPAAWTAAGTLVVLTGTLRIVAEQHYFTDVLAGTAVGAAAGVAVPLLHRNGVRVTGNGLAFSF